MRWLTSWRPGRRPVRAIPSWRIVEWIPLDEWERRYQAWAWLGVSSKGEATRFDVKERDDD